MKRRHIALVLAATVASAMSGGGKPASGSETENCYGVSLKGQNDCASSKNSCAGQAAIDYDGQSWKSVPKGSCSSMKTPYGTGSLVEIKRPA